MGCATSSTTTQADEPILIKPKVLKFKSKTQNVQELVRKQFVDNRGKTYYVIPKGDTYERVPVLGAFHCNPLFLRRVQSKQSSSLGNINTVQNSYNQLEQQ